MLLRLDAPQLPVGWALHWHQNGCRMHDRKGIMWGFHAAPLPHIWGTLRPIRLDDASQLSSALNDDRVSEAPVLLGNPWDILWVDEIQFAPKNPKGMLRFPCTYQQWFRPQVSFRGAKRISCIQYQKMAVGQK